MKSLIISNSLENLLEDILATKLNTKLKSTDQLVNSALGTVKICPKTQSTQYGKQYQKTKNTVHKWSLIDMSQEIF